MLCTGGSSGLSGFCRPPFGPASNLTVMDFLKPKRSVVKLTGATGADGSSPPCSAEAATCAYPAPPCANDSGKFASAYVSPAVSASASSPMTPSAFM
jgi:hypothetical protein